MRKFLLTGTALAAATACWLFFKNPLHEKKDLPKERIIQAEIGKEDDDENEGYDGAAALDQFEFERMKDPSLGYVPSDRMMSAIEYTETQKAKMRTMRVQSALNWTERGPIYDLVGASGNSRGSGTPYTGGRTSAILIDTLNDATGNTVYCGGIAGGLWKCTNFLSAAPNWVATNDRFDNLAITSICQNPANASEIYFSTGEATSNGDAVYGGGIWKSSDAGVTWTKLASSTGFQRVFKIVCDAAGDVFVGNRNSNLATSQVSGIYRSADGGSTWSNITPSGTTSSNNICTDIEVSTTGKLHASFGYATSGTTNKIQHFYTTTPATVTNASGWNASAGIRLSGLYALRLELATQGDVLYGVTTNSGSNVDSCYKSMDGGATWTLQNTAVPTTGILNSQGWYNITVAINPSNSAELVIGGLDLYKSSNSGSTFPTKLTSWIGDPYVHADHHFIQWWNIGGQSRIVIGCDGGVFLSNDGGTSFSDRNRNLAIKQFYGADLHPTAGSNYMIAGAQDNGVHQFTQPGKSYSTEVYGGDGFLVHINQANPQVQFGTYVYNTYRRTTDGGTTWSSFAFGSTSGSSPNGLFVNPYDYDDGQNILYSCFGTPSVPNQMLRWPNANTGATANAFTIAAMAGNYPSMFKVSPFTKNRVYIGGTSGKLIRLDNASTVTSGTIDANVTTLTGSNFPAANLSCVNVGSNDNNLVAVFSNYGVAHVFVSTDGGANWTNISGNLPDIPVRWAVFDPQNNSKMYLATEAGVYYTDAINGASTSWTSDVNFPTVRTDMFRIRLSDNTVVAATHGRGLFTAQIPATPELRFATSGINVTEATTGTTDCRGYTDYTIPVTPVAAPSGNATVTYSVTAGHTATEGIDFDYTTNGNFSSMSKQQAFSSGSTASQNITVRVYDDAALEGDETFTITFGVSGSTDAFAGAYNNYTFTVKDNDVVPSTPVAPATYSVGTYTVNASSTSSFRSNRQRHRVQFLYRASELTALGAAKGNITSLTTTVVTKNSTQPFRGYTVSIGNTASNNLYNDFETSLTQVYTGDYTSVVGDNTFAFGTGAGSASSFTWDGVSNIVVQFCFDNGANPADANADVMQGSNPFNTGSAPDNYASIYSDVLNSGGSSGCSLPAWFISNSRVNMKFYLGITGNPTETALNASKTAYLSPNDDVYFYTPTGNIIARIKNLSGSNYACTQATVDRAGTGAVAFWDNNPADYLTSKSLQIVPTTNNPSGQYQITLYYTAAEKAGWEAATGQNWNNIQLVKVKSQIKNYTSATPGPDGPNAVEIVTPTLGTFGSDYTLTATFNSGFSGFAAGMPGINPLPLTLLKFEGSLNNNSALLNWSTSSEQNAKNFDVEKSTDGSSFYKIGSVAAAGNSSTRNDYSLRDQQLSALNYYRLRMNDNDGHFKYSNVVLINYSSAVQKVTVVNNPFNDYLDIRFAKRGANAKLQVIGLTGTVLAQREIANPSGQIHWTLPVNLSAGTYVLRSIVDDEIFTSKLIKQ